MELRDNPLLSSCDVDAARARVVRDDVDYTNAGNGACR
jgi:hypothetical protein